MVESASCDFPSPMMQMFLRRKGNLANTQHHVFQSPPKDSAISAAPDRKLPPFIGGIKYGTMLHAVMGLTVSHLKYLDRDIT